MSRSAYWVVLLFITVVCLSGCARAPQPSADPGVDLSDPNVGGGAGQATGPETPVPTATATREPSPRLAAGEGPTAAAPAATATAPQPTAAPATAAPTLTATPEAPPTERVTATPPVETATPTPGGERIHVVEAGENLYRIGLQYGLSWVAIAEYNGITDPNQISVGQQLRIPPSPTATATLEASAGDRRPMDAGRRVSPTVEPAEVRDQPSAVEAVEAGSQPPVVIIPTHTVAAGDTLYGISRRYGVEWAQLAEANGLATPNQLYPGQLLKIPPDVAGPTPVFGHQVHRGETLSGLARQYGLSAAELAEANGLVAPFVIYTGQVLVIPGK